MTSPKIFVRKCPRCAVLVQTADQTGKTPCDDCAAKGPSLPVVAQPPPPPAFVVLGDEPSDADMDVSGDPADADEE